jgi:hypothetical protein
MSLAVDGFPNIILLGGPNSEPGTSHSMIVFETPAVYATNCVLKVQFEHIKCMSHSPAAVSAFTAYLKRSFCRGKIVSPENGCSAYRDGGAEGVSARLWPGSVLHLMRALRYPRWQDWDMDHYKVEQFGYLVKGWTEAELEGGNTLWYLDEVDFRPVSGEMCG